MPIAFTTRAPLSGRRGAVATSSYLATETGMSVLRRGGNCVDAAIAAGVPKEIVLLLFQEQGKVRQRGSRRLRTPLATWRHSQRLFTQSHAAPSRFS